MKNVIEELWRGNIRPLDRAIREGSEFEKRRRELSEAIDAFSSDLSKEKWEELDNILTIFGNLSTLSETDAFVLGFRLGAQFAQEMQTEHIGQFDLI